MFLSVLFILLAPERNVPLNLVEETVLLEVRVPHEFVHGGPQLAINLETTAQKVKFVGAHIWKQGFQGNLIGVGRVREAGLSCRHFYAVEHRVHFESDALLLGKFLGRQTTNQVICGDRLQDQLQGMQVGLTWEERQAVIDLCKNAAYSPQIHRLVVLGVPD